VSFNQLDLSAPRFFACSGRSARAARDYEAAAVRDTLKASKRDELSTAPFLLTFAWI